MRWSNRATWRGEDGAETRAGKFYHYMKAFGFGERTGIELPSETRGLLRPPSRWGATSIVSLAIGQEVGVTPVQLVTMVSTIANGGDVSAATYSAELDR